MFKCRYKLAALFRIVAQPVKMFCEAPPGRINAAAPIYRGQIHLARDFCNSRGFFPRAVIAPEIIIVERRESFANGDYARTGGVECESADVIPVPAGSLQRLPGGERQCFHLICVGLRCEVRIFFFALQWIFRGGKTEAAALAIKQRKSDT